LFIAVQFIDVLWAIFVLLGIEKVRIVPGITASSPLDLYYMPYTHSLVGALGWSLLAFLVCQTIPRWRGARAGVILAVACFSHWILDLIVHRPDLPIAPGLATRVGLGLWNRPTATLVVEGALFALGLSVYLVATRAKDRRGAIGLWSLVVFIVGIYVSSVLGPPPPSASAMAPVTLAFGILIAPWAFWVDRHRAMRREEAR